VPNVGARSLLLETGDTLDYDVTPRTAQDCLGLDARGLTGPLFCGHHA